MRDIPFPKFHGDAESDEADEFYSEMHSRLATPFGRRNGHGTLIELAKVCKRHGVEVVYYEDGGSSSLAFVVVKAGEPAFATSLSDEKPRDGDMRVVPYPDPDTLATDVAYDAFIDAIGHADHDQPYDLLQSADRMLAKFGLEVVCFEGTSDLTFDVEARQEAAAPVKRSRGAEVVEINGPRELQIEALLDESGLDAEQAEKVRAALNEDTPPSFHVAPDRPVEGLEVLTLDDVVAMLSDPNILGLERQALHKRLDQIVLA